MSLVVSVDVLKNVRVVPHLRTKDMDIIIKTGFQSITYQIEFQPETMTKGKKLVDAEHVREVEEHRRNLESFLIKSRVIRQASVHATPYATSLDINSARFVTNVHCNCVYNKSGKCKHVAALIYFINNEESASKTSREQQWGKPGARQFAKHKYSKGEYFKKMMPHKYTQLHEPQNVLITYLKVDSPLKRIMEAQLTKNNKHTVKNVINSLLAQVELNLEEEECAACLQNFLIFCGEHSIYESQYKLDPNLREFFLNKVQLSEDEIIQLSCETVQQSSCNNWFQARRLRISASSNVHHIKILSRKPVENLVSDMLNPSTIKSSSTKYGLKMESSAKEKYEQMYNCTVKRVGVIVSKYQPWLCASLDGVVIDDGCTSKIVEFKCPSTCENKPVINDADQVSNVRYLEFINDKLELKKSDGYYTQIQVQMYVTGMSVCDLFVFSPVENGCCLIEVHRHEEFLKNVILKSEKFYFEQYLPALFATVATTDINKENTDNNDGNTDNLDSSNKDESANQKRSFTESDLTNILI
ncbi:uncharacterized protein LOC103570404 isoform X3 [Microplitis demolitor]|uniref:uncharacterized protein LOC103570404 isoform X3 n=1 Tax=Microplitis demolitor TaxID=69319 RepID=UPI0004CD9D9B|nr:uncharacterized protein LOC103570404 isoform X3 [Microplitis demolitor]XP_053597209.1 uncharacterized protein LOC103570404 isoform X3 [Microplitis demolitor]